MRHGILAFVGVLTLICLAVGDEPKRLDDQVADETDEGRVKRDRTDLDPEIVELKVRLGILLNEERRLNETGEKRGLVEVRKRIEDAERNLYKLQVERNRRLADRSKGRHSDDLDEPAQRIEHIRIAAKHLEAAGMHDQAHELLEKAEAMELGHRTNEIDDLRREFEELQSQNQKLQRKVDVLEQEFNEFRDRPVFRFTR